MWLKGGWPEKITFLKNSDLSSLIFQAVVFMVKNVVKNWDEPHLTFAFPVAIKCRRGLTWRHGRNWASDLRGSWNGCSESFSDGSTPRPPYGRVRHAPAIQRRVSRVHGVKRARDYTKPTQPRERVKPLKAINGCVCNFYSMRTFTPSIEMEGD